MRLITRLLAWIELPIFSLPGLTIDSLAIKWKLFSVIGEAIGSDLYELVLLLAAALLLSRTGPAAKSCAAICWLSPLFVERSDFHTL